MRRGLWFSAAAALLVFPLGASGQQQDSQKPVAPGPPAASAPAPTAPQGGTASAAQVTQTPPQPDSLAAAARRAREEKKDSAKAARVFDNDNLPSQGVISTVGNVAEPASGDNSGAPTGEGAAPAPAGASGTPTDEKGWRERFAKLRDTLATDEQELATMQRELSVLDVVMYPDPQKTLQQETTRGDINKKTADIEKQKKKIEADRQAIADAEDELRKSGGDSGWAR
jgi:hypothetical protein